MLTASPVHLKCEQHLILNMHHLREHYERQDTQELLETAKKDLTAEARAALADVLATRGITVSEAKTVGDQDLTQGARAPEYRRLASRWKRLIAFAIDVWGVITVLMILLSPLDAVSTEFYENAIVAVWLAYFLLRDSIPGQSVGKRLLGLRAIHDGSGSSCTWLRSIGRNIFHFFFVIDALFALGNDRMRLGDLLAGTVVVKV